MSGAWQAIRDGRWLNVERLTAYATILILGYALNEAWLFATADGVLDSLGRPLGTDFANVWSSGKAALEGRPEVALDPHQLKPYQQQLFKLGEDRFYGWHYPPMFLIPAMLLAMLPYVPALLVWLVTTGTLYVVSIRAIMRDTPVPARLVVLLAVAYPAAFACVTHGQNGFLSAALIGGGLALLPARPMLAGVLLGLLAYKPQYGILLPLALLLAGAWRTILAATCAALASAAASVALFGIDSWAVFAKFLYFTRETVLEQGGPGWSKLQGVFPAVRMLGGSIDLAYALQAVTIAALVLMVAWLWWPSARHGATYEQKAAGLILATTLATPYAFNYDMVVLAPAIAFLAKDGLARGFAPYEKSLLALLWALPLASRELTASTSVPWATIANALVLAMVVSKVRGAASARDTAPDDPVWIRAQAA